MSTSKSDVEQTVKAYATAFHTGDIEDLRAIFLPDCKLQFLQSGELKVFTANVWIDLVASRKSSSELGHSEVSTITQLDFAGPDCASATLEMIAPPTRFVDQLHLLRINDDWRIVAKTFHTEPA